MDLLLCPQLDRGLLEHYYCYYYNMSFPCQKLFQWGLELVDDQW